MGHGKWRGLDLSPPTGAAALRRVSPASGASVQLHGRPCCPQGSVRPSHRAALEGPRPTNPTEALSGGSTGWQDRGGSLAFRCFRSYGILCLSFPICKNNDKVVWTL